MSYDNACYDLARLFLEEEPDATELDIDSLAQRIQDAIEDFYFVLEDRRKTQQQD